VLLIDGGGRISWANRPAQEEFPDVFLPGTPFEAALESRTSPEVGRMEVPPRKRSLSDGDLRRAEHPGGPAAVYRYLRLPLEEAGPGYSLHCLINISEEKKLEELFILNLHQLKSMKEIVDILYESLSTQEVIYLILVAVTSQMGFGFNRAFFLQVRGKRLRGRIGIGPSSPEEAHQIWTRLGALNFSSLREVYQNLTRNGDVPDAHTQEIALRMDFDLESLTADPVHGSDPGREHGREPGSRDPAGKGPSGLMSALERGKPARIHAADATDGIDRRLFELLSIDAVAVVPLFVRGELAGVIVADNFITRKAITEADLNVLKTFAGYAGVALERSHLYDELRESVAKLQAANESLRKHQQKLLQAEKLSAIGEIAARVSHEIRNPLVAIGGLARSLLQDKVGSSLARCSTVDASSDASSQETVETLQIIVSEVNRLEKFLRGTLDFVKPRMAGIVSTDLNGAVRDSIQTFKKELAENSIELEIELLSEPLRCLMDPELFHHALSNLIKNAIEAMSRGGKLFLGIRRSGVSAMVHVGNTGPGIPAEVRPRIFEPFFTTKPEGTGLGLAIASQNIRGLGGKLELESSPAFKTMFKLTLPVEMSGNPPIPITSQTESKHEPNTKEVEGTLARRLS
jgi:signal transduction histidine kinase